MAKKSLKKSLYIFISAILVQSLAMSIDFYLRHVIEESKTKHHSILEVERTFLQMLVEENHSFAEAADRHRLAYLNDRINEIIHTEQLALDAALFDQHYRHYTQVYNLTHERRQLNQRLSTILPTLTSSVRYIHEHHIAYLKNLLARGKSDQDYDTGVDFKRSPVRSAPELDIIKVAVAIQTHMLDIFETFSKLEHGDSPAAIHDEFNARIESFYQMTNTLEDYSLDAQDGLLVEELLLNGRTFEDSFKRFLAIEKSIRELSAKKERIQTFLVGQLKDAIIRVETSYRHLEDQIETLQHFSMLVSAFMLGFLFFFGNLMIKSVRRTIGETRRIQDDLSYQIPVRESDFIEFGTIYSALNAMADTINSQVIKLEESRDLLEKRVDERTTELSQVNQQLLAEIQDRIENEKKRTELEAKLNRAEKMEAIGTLAGGVAHDLNNILSGIVSYPDLILMDLPQDHPLRDAVMTIKSSGEKAAAIVEDLLTLARRGIANHKPVDLNLLVNQFIHSPECGKILLYHPKVKIESRLTPGIRLINGSSIHLSKTIMNLVVNAAEAMPDGGTISIATTEICMDFTIHGHDDVKEGEYFKLTVSDTGEGIPPEDVERIFEPFFSRKKMGRSGTGLGMAVVWGTVKDHAGYIHVKSQPGTGTIFTLYFPLSRKTSVIQPDEPIPFQQYQGRQETVLVVDDVEEQRHIAKRILEKLGYRVACVASGEAAVEYLKAHAADILLLDMIMPPGMNGLETYRQIKALVPDQKAVIASGFSETTLVNEARRIGAGPYVKKPYSLEQIGLAIRNTLDDVDI